MLSSPITGNHQFHHKAVSRLSVPMISWRSDNHVTLACLHAASGCVSTPSNSEFQLNLFSHFSQQGQRVGDIQRRTCFCWSVSMELINSHAIRFRSPYRRWRLARVRTPCAFYTAELTINSICSHRNFAVRLCRYPTLYFPLIPTDCACRAYLPNTVLLSTGGGIYAVTRVSLPHSPFMRM
jgi:hypothetical protein